MESTEVLSAPFSGFISLALKSISMPNIRAKANIVATRCGIIMVPLRAMIYRIGTAASVNGDTMANPLCDGNISRLYKSLGSRKYARCLNMHCSVPIAVLFLCFIWSTEVVAPGSLATASGSYWIL